MKEIEAMSDEQLLNQTRDLESKARAVKNTITRLTSETNQINQRLKQHMDKVKLYMRLPYLVATVGELLDPIEEEEAAGSGFSRANPTTKKDETNKAASGKAIVIKTSSRQSFYQPTTGMVDSSELTPGELIAVNKESYVVYEKLPPEYDSRVKAMEVDERPTEEYSDIGGLDKQIEELVEAIVLPMT